MAASPGTAAADQNSRPATSGSTLNHALARYRVELTTSVAPLARELELQNSRAGSPHPLDATDLTQDHDQRVQAVAEACLQLTECARADAAFARAVELLVPTLAEWVAIDIVNSSGRSVRVANAAANTVPPHVRIALQNLRLASVSKRTASASLLDEASSRAKRIFDLGVTSLIVSPLRSPRRFIGSLALVSVQSSRRFGTTDLALANCLAALCVLAVENSELHHAVGRAIAARDEFLSAVSEELRTPLSHVKGFVSTLRQPDVALEAEVLDDFLDEVEREADRLAGAIENLIHLCSAT